MLSRHAILLPITLLAAMHAAQLTGIQDLPADRLSAATLALALWMYVCYATALIAEVASARAVLDENEEAGL